MLSVCACVCVCESRVVSSKIVTFERLLRANDDGAKEYISVEVVLCDIATETETEQKSVCCVCVRW